MDDNIEVIDDGTPMNEPVPAQHITEFFFEEIEPLAQKLVFEDLTASVEGGDPSKLSLPPEIATADKTGRMKTINREPQKKLMKFLKDFRKLLPHKIPRVKIGGNGLIELKQCAATQVLKYNIEIEYADERKEELKALVRQKSLALYHEKGNFMVDDALEAASARLKKDQLRYVNEMEAYLPSVQCPCAKRGVCSGMGNGKYKTKEKYEEELEPLTTRKTTLANALRVDEITFKSMKIKDSDNNLMSIEEVAKEDKKVQEAIYDVEMQLRCVCTCFFCLSDRKHTIAKCDCCKFERRDKAREIIPHYKPKREQKCKCELQAQRERSTDSNRSSLASSCAIRGCSCCCAYCLLMKSNYMEMSKGSTSKYCPCVSLRASQASNTDGGPLCRHSEDNPCPCKCLFCSSEKSILGYCPSSRHYV